MEARTLKYLANACNGRLANAREEATFTSVCSDSRALKAGDLFWAITGERFDGHDYVPAAIEAGAVGAVVSAVNVKAEWKKLPLVIVSDTRAALGMFGAKYRADFSPEVVAVAGSNGKTTTKDILNSVLRVRFETIASEASFNNEIGVPLTLLRIGANTQAAVLELGTNHPGELAPLARMAAPRVGVITSIGREHLEFFGSLEGVAQEEGALAEALPAHGALVLNGDTPEAVGIRRRAKCRVVTVGIAQRNEWHVDPLATDESGTQFLLTGPDENWSGEWRVSLLGRHQACNAALAILVGRDLGLSRDEVQRGLAECRPAKMRMQVERIGGAVVLNDAYNANADSMRAALATLAEFPAKNRRIAILGDMAELGEGAAAAHREVGTLAGQFGIDHVVAIGQQAIVTADCARSAGAKNAAAFTDFSTALTAVSYLAMPGDVILVKASRSARLERVVEALRKSRSAPGSEPALAA